MKTGRSSPPDRGSRAAGWILAVTLAGAALALGAVHTAVLCSAAALLVIGTLVSVVGATPMQTRPTATVLFATAVGLTLYTALQCVPLPQHLLVALSPHVADVWARALAPLGEPGPRWEPLSLDPGATRVEVLKGCAYLLAFVVALRVARKPEGRNLLGGAIVLTGVVLAVSALLHPAFGAKRVFGVYEPGPGVGGRHLAPLLNPNHLAAYLNLAFCLALSATIGSKPPVPRVIAGAVVLLLGATQLWIASRGGVASMVLAVILVAAVSRGARSRLERKGAWVAIATGAALAAGTAMILFASTESLRDELFQTDLSKLALAGQGLRLAAAAPLFGVGRGAFETAFPFAFRGVGYALYTHPENVVVQWCSEWGFAVSFAAFGAIGFALRPTALPRFSGAAGAWSAIVVNSVHNLVDFSSELPGVALSTVVCAAIVAAGSTGRRPLGVVDRWFGAPRALLAAICSVACVGAIVSVLPGLGHDAAMDRRAAYDAVETQHLTAQAMHSLARASMLRHPGEPYLPFAVALRATRVGDDNPMPWIAATLDRATIYGPAHIVLAEALSRRFPAQARLELRLAVEQDPFLVSSAVRDAVYVVGGYKDALEVLPQGDPTGVLQELVPKLRKRLPSTAYRLDVLLSAREPSLGEPILRAAEDGEADLEDPGSSWCVDAGRVECVAKALTLAHRLEQAAPNKCAGYVYEARVLAEGGDHNGALALLQGAASFTDDRQECLGALITAAIAAGQRERAEDALEATVRAGCSDDDECAQRLTWVAAMQRTLGNTRSALITYKLAYEKAPDNDAALEALAQVSTELGLHGEAMEYFERLASRHADDGRWSASAKREREALLKGLSSAGGP